jgi:hypothetical protein
MSPISYYRALAATVVVMQGLFAATSAHAANRYFVGGASDRWETAANWSATPRGAGGATIPGASDVAILSYSGTTVRLRSAVTVQGLLLSNVWTGSLLQGTGTLTVGIGGIRVGSGRLVGGANAMNASGSYTQTGGIVTLQNTFILSGSLVITDGSAAGSPSFSSTGSVIFDGIDQTLTSFSSFIHTLIVRSTSGTTLADNVKVRSTFQVATGSTIDLGAYALALTGGTILNYGAMVENTGKIVHTGSIVITNGSYATVSEIDPQAAYFSLDDSDENISGTSLDTVSFTATTAGGDSETVTLTETSLTSGIFRGSIPAGFNAIVAGNSRLDATSSTTITASYTDAQDAFVATDAASFNIGAGSSGASSNTTSGGGGGSRRGSGSSHPPALSAPKPKTTTAKPLTAKEKAALKRKEAAQKKLKKPVTNSAAARRAERLMKRK